MVDRATPCIGLPGKERIRAPRVGHVEGYGKLRTQAQPRPLLTLPLDSSLRTRPVRVRTQRPQVQKAQPGQVLGTTLIVYGLLTYSQLLGVDSFCCYFDVRNTLLSADIRKP